MSLTNELVRTIRLRSRRRQQAQHGTGRGRRLGVERLEDRYVLSAPVGTGPLPAVTIGLTAKQVAHADAVINWNATMLRAIWNDGTPPTLASRVEAMVGVAVYDAVEGVHPIYALYPVPGLSARPARDASREAAAIAAADTVLKSLYPDQKALFDAEYQATLADVPDNKPTADGLAWGQTVANAVLTWRSQDGFNAKSNYQPAPPGGPAGVYELTPAAGLESKPPGFLPALTPQWGQVTPWAMTSAAQFLPPAPPAVGSAEYAAAFNEVKTLGDSNRYALPHTPQVDDDYQLAHFWADVPSHSVTPPGHWDEIAEHIALQQHLNLERNARLFALVNIGLADAAINCWDAKYIYDYWRPITAIRDARASQINPANSPDPNWTPLWNTPNFPSYTSGHSTFSGVASTILASVFGADFHFTEGSDDMPGYSRSFAGFAQAADEAGESRVVGGIHFAFDNTAGLTAGRALGGYIAQNFLLRIHDGGGAHSRVLAKQGDGSTGNAAVLLLQEETVATAIIGSTITHNLAQGGEADGGGHGGTGLGGGIYNAGTANVTRSTITYNKAESDDRDDGGSAGQGIGGRVYLAAGGSVRFDVFTVIRMNHASTSNDDMFP